MMFSLARCCFAPLLAGLVLVPTFGGDGKVSYNRDIRPILSDNCFFCHGPDANERKGKLRLDIREEAIGREAIVPGNPERSELIKRIFSEDPDELMPPGDAHKHLSEAQKEVLRKWVAEGAEYEGHWAYLPPVKPSTPVGANGVDYLVKERLKDLGLEPSPEADRRTLARRVHLDLVGLPPSPEALEAFERDPSPDAYQRLVDRLLASPHYGERMALGWLDAVRFADTIGYHSDNPRNIWPYRDYVIRAFNENKPFDQFTREQLAGDLLPEANLETRVASAFNRLLLTTEEGGAQEKDYEVRMLTDRVRAVGTVWLGQTIGCAQCHDHKFDPITMRDFYSMGAFFADIKEPIIGRREEGMMVPDKTQEAELARMAKRVEELQTAFDGPQPQLGEVFAKWEREQLVAIARESLWNNLSPAQAESAGGANLSVQPDDSILAKGKRPDKDRYTLIFTEGMKGVRGLRIEALSDPSLTAKGPGRAVNGNFVLTEITGEILRKDGKTEKVGFSGARASFEQTFAAEKNPEKKWAAGAAIDGNEQEFGWAIGPETGRNHQLVLQLQQELQLQEGDKLRLVLHQNHGHSSHTLGRFRVSATSSQAALEKPSAVPPVEAVELLARGQRSEEETRKLFGYFKEVTPELADLRKELAQARQKKMKLEASIPRCLVSVSAEKPRTVRILPRGNWMSEDGEIVEPALPEYLAGKKPEGKKLTRLDLANWLVSRENPLTARVVVNRLWKQFFGTGLSKVLDDFGAQGEPPPNQALLDWLASEFMDSGWDTKHMVRVIVTSSTYKQSSVPSAELQERDPYNRELAVQSRWRLEAELVRDNALAIAGLLETKIGGPSVRPYQPDGYWENLNFPPRTYESSKGEGQYRRGIYTWWQRSFVHPSMLAFDAPTREECAAERNRSNIPQQALVLMNDPSFVEASRVFAMRILKEGGADTRSRIDYAWRQALNRQPTSEEMETMEALVTKHQAEYKQNVEAARMLLNVGMSPVPEKVDAAELAAWSNAARVILNLHETITRS